MNGWAAIFDWDGVIVDTSRQHEQAWHLIAAEQGRVVPNNFFKRSFGMRNESVIPDLLRWTNDPAEIQKISLVKEAKFRELASRDGSLVLPGVREWLNQLRAAKIPCALGSSAPAENIRFIIEGLGLAEHFSARVCGEDVERGKPNPEVFLKAAQRLGFEPNRCVVFEDAHVGIEAALAAGMKVVGVTTTHPADSLIGAHRMVNRLDELSLDELDGWFK